MEFEPIICLETHVELKTESKLFCACRVTDGAPPNAHICPVCTGQPGSLPVLNQKAVILALKSGLALHCAINRSSLFARKNYFYPDLPKGYQISQYERPLCGEGFLEIAGDGGRPYRVGIGRIHLEEDAGKLTHAGTVPEGPSFSLVDYNRSGVPLLEIVGDHENNPLRSPKEARSYLEKLRQILRHLEVSDCALERGQFRFDVNISIRPRGAKDFGRRVEIKNMSSFRFAVDALEYEIERHKAILRSGGEVAQETRSFDEARRITAPMRSKEDAPDYRYFPDPDLVEMDIDPAALADIQRTLPELPDQKVARFVQEYGLPAEEASLMTRDKEVSEFFVACTTHSADHKRLARWIVRELFALLKEASLPIDRLPVTPEDFSSLVNLIGKKEVTERMARDILKEMVQKGKDPASIIREKALTPIQDPESLDRILEQVIAENPQAVSKIKEGITKPVHFLVGQVMRKTAGKADPDRLHELIRKRLLP